MRDAFPGLPVYARAWDVNVAQRLRSMGATYATAETMETSLQLAGNVLRASGVSADAAALLVDEFSKHERSKIAKPPRPDRYPVFKDILLVLAPSDDETAVLEHAAALAEDNQATLTVVDVLAEATGGAERDEHGVSSPDDLDDEIAEDRRGQLEALVVPLRERLDVQTKVLVGKPHEEIAREIVRNGRDLVLKTAGHRHQLRERLFGGSDQRLLRTCPCPVLLVRSILSKPYRYRRVVAGLYLDEYPARQRDDRHALNRTILEHAAWLATTEFAELHVIHAWEAYGEHDLRSGRSPYHWDADAYVEREHKRNQEALDKLLAEVHETVGNEALPAFNPMTYLAKGSPRDEIIRLAVRLQADLVVLGTAARSGITALIVENTAEAIIKALDCSVLVVKPPGFIPPVVVDD